MARHDGHKCINRQAHVPTPCTRDRPEPLGHQTSWRNDIQIITLLGPQATGLANAEFLWARSLGPSLIVALVCRPPFNAAVFPKRLIEVAPKLFAGSWFAQHGSVERVSILGGQISVAHTRSVYNTTLTSRMVTATPASRIVALIAWISSSNSSRPPTRMITRTPLDWR